MRFSCKNVSTAASFQLDRFQPEKKIFLNHITPLQSIIISSSNKNQNSNRFFSRRNFHFSSCVLNKTESTAKTSSMNTPDSIPPHQKYEYKYFDIKSLTRKKRKHSTKSSALTKFEEDESAKKSSSSSSSSSSSILGEIKQKKTNILQQQIEYRYLPTGAPTTITNERFYKKSDKEAEEFLKRIQTIDPVSSASKSETENLSSSSILMSSPPPPQQQQQPQQQQFEESFVFRSVNRLMDRIISRARKFAAFLRKLIVPACIFLFFCWALDLLFNPYFSLIALLFLLALL